MVRSGWFCAVAYLSAPVCVLLPCPLVLLQFFVDRLISATLKSLFPPLSSTIHSYILFPDPLGSKNHLCRSPNCCGIPLGFPPPWKITIYSYLSLPIFYQFWIHLRIFLLIPGEINFLGARGERAFEKPEYMVSTKLPLLTYALMLTKNSPGGMIPVTKSMFFILISNYL